MQGCTRRALQLTLASALVESLARAQTYCDAESDDGWCSNDLNPSIKNYVTWLTATCLAVFFLLWFDKKLMCMVMLWWLIALAFIYVQNSMVWTVMNVVNIVVYFVFFRSSSDNDENQEEQQLENKERFDVQLETAPRKPEIDSSWLDPFGEHKTQQLLYDVIESKLKQQREQKLKQMAKNKSDLLQEIERKKREVSKFRKQEERRKRNERNSVWAAVKWIFDVKRKKQPRNKYRIGVEENLQTHEQLQTPPQLHSGAVVQKNIDLKSPTYQ